MHVSRFTGPEAAGKGAALRASFFSAHKETGLEREKWLLRCAVTCQGLEATLHTLCPVLFHLVHSAAYLHLGLCQGLSVFSSRAGSVQPPLRSP